MIDLHGRIADVVCLGCRRLQRPRASCSSGSPRLNPGFVEAGGRRRSRPRRTATPCSPRPTASGSPGAGLRRACSSRTSCSSARTCRASGSAGPTRWSTRRRGDGPCWSPARSLTVMSGLRFVRHARTSGAIPVVIVNRGATRGDDLADVPGRRGLLRDPDGAGGGRGLRRAGRVVRSSRSRGRRRRVPASTTASTARSSSPATPQHSGSTTRIASTTWNGNASCVTHSSTASQRFATSRSTSHSVVRCSPARFGTCSPSTPPSRTPTPLDALVVGERPDPDVPDGLVAVHVEAASLNMHDLWTLRGVGIKRGAVPDDPRLRRRGPARRRHRGGDLPGDRGPGRRRRRDPRPEAEPAHRAAPGHVRRRRRGPGPQRRPAACGADRRRSPP